MASPLPAPQVVPHPSSSDLDAGGVSFAQAHPELANIIITALLWSLGDILAQLLERYLAGRRSHLPLPQSPAAAAGLSVHYAPTAWSFNLARTARIGSYAGLLFAPATKLWFETLEFLIPGQGFAVALQRMLLDQAFYSSCVIVSLFLWVGLLESSFSPSYAWNKVRTNYWPAITANWMVWPFLQLIIQGVVPLESRMLVGALANIPWTAYLAWRSGGQPPAKV